MCPTAAATAGWGMWRWIWIAGRSGRWWCRGACGCLACWEEDRVFPWEAVRRFGADTILVETPPLSRLGKGN